MKVRGFLLFLITALMLTFTPVACFALPEAADADDAASKAAVSDISAESIGIGAAGRVPSPEISAPSAILVEAETGQVLYHKNSEAPLHISAACKLMTVLVAVEKSSLSSYVTVSSDSVDTEGSALSLQVGAKYLMSDLLHAIMLTSANDAAVAVAESVSSGDIKKFVDMMNETAKNAGMTQTQFTNIPPACTMNCNILRQRIFQHWSDMLLKILSSTTYIRPRSSFGMMLPILPGF